MTRSVTKAKIEEAKSTVNRLHTPVLRESASLVELLAWTYKRQKADVMSGRGLWTPEIDAEAESEAARLGMPVRQWSTCGCAQLEAIALLGARIDGGGWQRAALHVDAEVVHDELIEMSRVDWMGATLLRQYGRQDDVPEWSGGTQEFEPVRDARDRIVQNHFDEVVTHTDAFCRQSQAPVCYCPVQLYPSNDWVEMVRGEYQHWFAALEKFALRLQARTLVRWQVSGLGAPREPWVVANKIANSEKSG